MYLLIASLDIRCICSEIPEKVSSLRIKVWEVSISRCRFPCPLCVCEFEIKGNCDLCHGIFLSFLLFLSILYFDVIDDLCIFNKYLNCQCHRTTIENGFKRLNV